MNLERLKEQLILHEALRLKPYKDTKGKLTIGIGRNLTDVGISDLEARFLCDNDIENVMAQLDGHIGWWRQMDEVRQRVILDMCFNMGIGKLKGFINTLPDMEAGKFVEAAENMLQSKWAKVDVGVRAGRLAKMMRTGEDYA